MEPTQSGAANPDPWLGCFHSAVPAVGTCRGYVDSALYGVGFDCLPEWLRHRGLATSSCHREIALCFHLPRHAAALSLTHTTPSALVQVLLGFSLLLGHDVTPDALGILVGHLYFYLADVWPALASARGWRWRKILHTPKLLHLLFGTAPRRPAVRAVDFEIVREAQQQQPPQPEPAARRGAVQDGAGEPAREPEAGATRTGDDIQRDGPQQPEAQADVAAARDAR